jgi:hypothetical protein
VFSEGNKERNRKEKKRKERNYGELCTFPLPSYVPVIK